MPLYCKLPSSMTLCKCDAEQARAHQGFAGAVNAACELLCSAVYTLHVLSQQPLPVQAYRC